MSTYRVHLDVFAGPLDLLLYLVRKEEVDIYDIPIANITAQYIEYIEMLRGLDIDLAGDFLVMAATLMEIKSAMLLPRSDDSEQDEGGIEDPRAELVRQLLEYKRFKDAANLLGESAQTREQRFTRPASILEHLKPTEEPEVDLEQVSIWTLLEAFDGIMKATGHAGRFDHIKDDTPIDLYQIEILHRLQSEGPLSMAKIFEGRRNRLVMIGLFLGMLELMRNRLVWVEQPDEERAIYLKPLTSEPAEAAVQRAIYSDQLADEDEEPLGAEQAAQAGEDDESALPATDSDEPASSDVNANEEPEPAAEKDGDGPKRAPIAIRDIPASSSSSESQRDNAEAKKNEI